MYYPIERPPRPRLSFHCPSVLADSLFGAALSGFSVSFFLLFFNFALSFFGLLTSLRSDEEALLGDASLLLLLLLLLK